MVLWRHSFALTNVVQMMRTKSLCSINLACSQVPKKLFKTDSGTCQTTTQFVLRYLTFLKYKYKNPNIALFNLAIVKKYQDQFVCNPLFIFGCKLRQENAKSFFIFQTFQLKAKPTFKIYKVAFIYATRHFFRTKLIPAF